MRGRPASWRCASSRAPPTRSWLRRWGSPSEPCATTGRWPAPGFVAKSGGMTQGMDATSDVGPRGERCMSEHTGMGPARYERIKELFSMAIGIERTEREALLSRACASDVELRGDVERLLAAHDDATFLENPDEQLARLWS